MAVPPAELRPQKSAVMMQTPSGSPRPLSVSARACSHCAASCLSARGSCCVKRGPLHHHGRLFRGEHLQCPCIMEHHQGRLYVLVQPPQSSDAMQNGWTSTPHAQAL